MKKASQTEKKEELHTEQNAFLLTTRTSPISSLLFLGGTDKYCLECQIFPNNSVGNIPTIAYDERCSLLRKFERGTDPISLLNLCLSYIRQQYPYIKQLIFQDYSYRECANSTIDLAPFYYLLYEKTWYMNKMRATFYYPEEATRFAAANIEFQDLKQIMTWEEYDAYVTTDHPLPTMKEIYQSYTSWTAFFNELKSRLDMDILCEYMSPWITRFIKQVAKIQFNAFTFVIDVPEQSIPFTIKPMISRGGTRKQRRFRKAIDLR